MIVVKRDRDEAKLPSKNNKKRAKICQQLMSFLGERDVKRFTHDICLSCPLV